MTSSIVKLSEASAPWFARYAGTPADAYDLAWRLTAEGGVVRVLRGNKMRTATGLFDEIGAAFQFPDYFGENWAALDECLQDLSWLPANRYVVVIVRADLVLADERLEVVGLLGDLLAGVCVGWAEPVTRGELFDHPAIPFHVVLQSSSGRGSASFGLWGHEIAQLTG